MSVAPFTEDEQRFLLTEILKASTVPVETLLSVIRDEDIQPIWDEVGLPSARNVKNSAAEFNRLLGLDATHPISQRDQRAYLAGGQYKSPVTKAREIKPKPISNGAPSPAVSAPAAGTPRRRGRPSNAEIALRAKEAAERGEEYPPASASKKRKSMADLPVAEPATPGSAPPVKRGRGRPPKNKPAVLNPQSGDAKPSEGGLAGGGVTEEALQRNAYGQSDAGESLDAISPGTRPVVPSGTTALKDMIDTSQDDSDALEQPNLAY